MDKIRSSPMAHNVFIFPAGLYSRKKTIKFFPFYKKKNCAKRKIKFFLFFLLFFFPFLKAQYLIVGDSQSFYLEKSTKKAKIYAPYTKVGIGIKELNNIIESRPTNEYLRQNTKIIFLSIGTNDNYYDYGISKLLFNLRENFPYAYFFVVMGSYGWGNITASPDTYNNYYKKFFKQGCFVFNQIIGFGDPHNMTKKQYQILGNAIEKAIEKIEKEKQ